ncbi:MAG: hypothetical protein RIT27_546 [Pseudomonadota bacterium]|jgi:hypothetical protein
MATLIQFLPEEQALLETTAQRLGCSQSDLIRQAVLGLCQKMLQKTPTPYSLGEDLFEMGDFALPPTDQLKYQIWEKLRVKHQIMG